MEPPLADITDNLVNSPMSVSSNKSDGSLSDIRRLTALSLTINSPPPIMQRGADTPQTPLSNNSVTGAMGGVLNDNATPRAGYAASLAATEGEEENINHSNNLFDLEDEFSKSAFVDAFLKGIMTDFGGGGGDGMLAGVQASRRNSSTSSDAPMTGDEDLLNIDLLNEDFLLDMIEEEDHDEKGTSTEQRNITMKATLEDDDDLLNSSTGSVENSILQRSVSSPGAPGGRGSEKPHLGAGASGPPSPRIRRSASLADGNINSGRSASRKPSPTNITVGSANSATKSKKRTPKKSRLSRMKSESALASRGSTAGATHPYLNVGVGRNTADIPPELRRRHTVSGGGGGGRLFFENKEYFKIRSHLRDLVRKGHNNDELPGWVPEMKGSLAKMKSARLFLGMLTKHCKWAAESVKATPTPISESGMMGGEDGSGDVADNGDPNINMENFTKRHITVLNDIPPERV